jgi:hypothetical protein
MHYGRNILFSSQQIWDCTGEDANSNCEHGTIMSKLIQSMHVGSFASKSLVPYECSNYLSTSPSSQKCMNTFSNCSLDTDGPTILVSSVYANEIDVGNNGKSQGLNGNLAAKALMSEIWINGPVVAILDIYSVDFDAFSNLGYNGIFVPSWNEITQQNTQRVRHCIMVYGWGFDNVTGYNYWLVQNSYGKTWAKNGRGKIIRGFNWLENEWRGLSTKQRPCTNGSFCISKSMYNDSFVRNRNQIISDEWNNFINMVYNGLKRDVFDLYIRDSNVYIEGLSNDEILLITLLSGLGLLIIVFSFIRYKKNKGKNIVNQTNIYDDPNYIRALLFNWQMMQDNKLNMMNQYLKQNSM